MANPNKARRDTLRALRITSERLEATEERIAKFNDTPKPFRRNERTRVVVIDADEARARDLRRQLTRLGIDVVIAASVQRALREAGGFEIAVVRGDAGGIDGARELVGARPRVRVVLYGGARTSGELRAAATLGEVLPPDSGELAVVDAVFDLMREMR